MLLSSRTCISELVTRPYAKQEEQAGDRPAPLPLNDWRRYSGSRHHQSVVAAAAEIQLAFLELKTRYASGDTVPFPIFGDEPVEIVTKLARL
jgi:hypothetical protein